MAGKVEVRQVHDVTASAQTLTIDDGASTDAKSDVVQPPGELSPITLDPGDRQRQIELLHREREFYDGGLRAVTVNGNLWTQEKLEENRQAIINAVEGKDRSELSWLSEALKDQKIVFVRDANTSSLDPYEWSAYGFLGTGLTSPPVIERHPENGLIFDAKALAVTSLATDMNQLPLFRKNLVRQFYVDRVTTQIDGSASDLSFTLANPEPMYKSMMLQSICSVLTADALGLEQARDEILYLGRALGMGDFLPYEEVQSEVVSVLSSAFNEIDEGALLRTREAIKNMVNEEYPGLLNKTASLMMEEISGSGEMSLGISSGGSLFLKQSPSVDIATLNCGGDGVEGLLWGVLHAEGFDSPTIKIDVGDRPDMFAVASIAKSLGSYFEDVSRNNYGNQGDVYEGEAVFSFGNGRELKVSKDSVIFRKDGRVVGSYDRMFVGDSPVVDFAMSNAGKDWFSW